MKYIIEIPEEIKKKEVEIELPAYRVWRSSDYCDDCCNNHSISYTKIITPLKAYGIWFDLKTGANDCDFGKDDIEKCSIEIDTVPFNGIVGDIDFYLGNGNKEDWETAVSKSIDFVSEIL